MTVTERPNKKITIHAKEEEWVRRVVSKLLLSGTRWSVYWSETSIAVHVKEEDLGCLAKKLTAPTFRYGMNTKAAERFLGIYEWESWKSDSRFMDYLLTDERFDSMKFDIYESLKTGHFDVDGWISSSEVWENLMDETLMDVKEGQIGQKMMLGGWV